eukprot:UN09781
MSVKELQELYKKFDHLDSQTNKQLDLIESGQIEGDQIQIKIQQDVAPKVKEMFNILESLKFAYRDLDDVSKQ